MEQQMIFSVSEANNFIKALLDRVPQLQEIFVRGEISELQALPLGPPLLHAQGRRGRDALRACSRETPCVCASVPRTA